MYFLKEEAHFSQTFHNSDRGHEHVYKNSREMIYIFLFYITYNTPFVIRFLHNDVH